MIEGKKHNICLRILGAVLLSCLCMAAAACGSFIKPDFQTDQTTESRKLPKELIDSDAVAYEVSCTNEGPFDWDSDYWQEMTYIIHYNCDLEIITKYSKSGEKKRTGKLSVSDFYEIRDMFESYRENKKMYDETLDHSKIMDGTTYGFTSYEPDGQKSYLYGGYVDGCTELECIVAILNGYGRG